VRKFNRKELFALQITYRQTSDISRQEIWPFQANRLRQSELIQAETVRPLTQLTISQAQTYQKRKEKRYGQVVPRSRAGKNRKERRTEGKKDGKHGKEKYRGRYRYARNIPRIAPQDFLGFESPSSPARACRRSSSRPRARSARCTAVAFERKVQLEARAGGRVTRCGNGRRSPSQIGYNEI